MTRPEITDLLRLADRVANSIQLGESQFREFKSAWEGSSGNKKPRAVKSICANVGEELVGFANADGGDLLIGVEDDGTVTGVPHNEEALEVILNAVETHVFAGQKLPIITKGTVLVGNHKVVFFSVSKGTTQVYQLPDGRCLRRRDSFCEPVAVDSLRFERQEIVSREYERQFVDGATVADLDLVELQIMANSLLKGLSVERYLQQLGLGEYATGGMRLRRAALLLFGKDIARWHPRSQLRVLGVLGSELLSGPDYNVREDVTVTGNIMSLLSRAWEQLRPFLVQGTSLSADARFETRVAYPELACREALVNALAHRDYSIQNPIEVFVYNDRMEVRSPGALLSTLHIKDLEELRGAHESRNSLIARVLREHKVMRELGEGMRRIFEAMETQELARPRLYSNGYSFSVTLAFRSLFYDEQLAFLAEFGEFGLSRLQKRIVAAGMGDRELSQKAISSAMNSDDRNTYDQEVTGLRKMGVLVEIRNNLKAQALAKSLNRKKSEIGRFRVAVPQQKRRPSAYGVISPPQPRPPITSPSAPARTLMPSRPPMTSPPSPPMPVPVAELTEIQSSPTPTRLAPDPSHAARSPLFPELTGVYIANPPADARENDFKELLQRFGEVRQVLLSRAKGFAVVFMSTEEQAQAAIEELYGVEFLGTSLRVTPFRSKLFSNRDRKTRW